MLSLPAKLLSTALTLLFLSSTVNVPVSAYDAGATSSDLHFVVIPVDAAYGDSSSDKVMILPRESSGILSGTVEESRMIAVKEVIVPDAVQTAGTSLVQSATADIIVVDNDEFKAAPVEKYAYKEIADSPDKTFIEAGARFPVHMSTTITSKTAKVGDPVEGRLKIDLKIGGKLSSTKRFGCGRTYHPSQSGKKNDCCRTCAQQAVDANGWFTLVQLRRNNYT